MKALSNFNITILLSAFVVLPAVSNADNILAPVTVSTSYTATPTYKEAVLYRFAGGKDGANPYNGLIQGSDGDFYGTTQSGGGANNYGTVFKITLQGEETVLYRFTGGKDGANPNYGGLIQGNDGNFYGTTLYGGGKNNNGTVFKITPQGQETILYRFAGGDDGANPISGVIQASDGNFYGTTTYGGGRNNRGTIFQITPQGVERVLHRFINGDDGANPAAVLIQGSDGNFYGTTAYGGSTGNGIVFRITPQRHETVLYSFKSGKDAANPISGLIQGIDGTFYSTTLSGGAKNKGTVFKVTPQGQETILYSFTGGDDGVNPYNGLIQDRDGNFYGTTSDGGVKHQGTVFKVTPQGEETVLYRFTGGKDGENPIGGLIQGTDGNFYGTTPRGGGSGYGTGYGTVFKIYQ